MEDNNLVKIETEDGETLNLLILEEFEYKNKKYALLSNLDNTCNCGEECDCDDDCNCGDDCKCNEDCNCEDDCNCGDHCNCGDDCNCGNHCDCGDDCNCEDDLYLLEITKDKDGSEIFKSIDDDKLFDEVSKELEKLLEK